MTARSTPLRAERIRKISRRKQKPVRGGETANPAREREQKTLDDQRKLFVDVPVRDAEWEPFPYADATVPDAALEEAKHKAIEAMGEWGVLSESSRRSGLGRYTLTKMLRDDPLFRLRMSAAKKNCIERLEREMIRRGQLKGGELAAIYVTKHNIKKYREIQRVELTGRNGAPVAYVDAKAELLKRLEEIVRKQKPEAEAIVVGEKPKLIKGGSDEGQVQVKKIKQGKWQESRK